MSDHNPTTDAVQADAHHDSHHAEIFAETTTMFGRTFPYPLYTVIFGILGVLTVSEILIAEVFTSWVKIVALLAFALAKAILVVMYYMHLKSDSKIFTLVLLLPVFIISISLMFLLVTPYGAAY